jgi:E3 ubiquitin-protein ligase HERC2
LEKVLHFSSIKNKYIKNIVNNLPTEWDQPSVEVKRRKAQVFRDTGKTDHKGEYTIFGQIWRKLKENNYKSMKKNDASGQSWSANFMGEGAIDAGGPYRESITNMCEELMHKVLPLFIPTPNNKSDHGLSRDCWTVNPSATSPTHLEMFEFVGALMGMAFRSGQVLDLKLAPSFYKSLSGEPLTIDDLKTTDLYAVQALKELQATKKSITEEMFDSYGAEVWATRLSNGEEFELVRGGKEKVVKHKEIEEYIKLTLEARFKEADKQIQAIRNGFEIIFPTSVMGILTAKEIEFRIVGPTEIDTDRLKGMTSYQSCDENDEYIQRFWRVFEQFTQEERSLYLKFVWGRSRLPPPDADRVQRHTIYLMHQRGSNSNHDQMLPQAHTCFFQLDLPRYSKDSICRDKIVYAIETCGEIDTDASSGAVLHDDTAY